MPQARKAKRSKADDDNAKTRAKDDNDVQDDTDDEPQDDQPDEQDEQDTEEQVEEQTEEQTGRDVDLKIHKNTVTVTVPKDGNAADTLHRVADFIDL